VQTELATDVAASDAGPSVRVQYGALPYRRNARGDIEIMLVTSRRTKRWIIPKGWPIDGLTPAGAAAQEAFEEAGVIGQVTPGALGSFIYEKQSANGKPNKLCQVTVFGLRVDQQMSEWPEASQREVLWVTCAQAAELVSDEGLKPLIQNMRV
jgi:8-oxo-dGTP pyrophosphatase MutT (NUDIX family)